ncbi:glycoside hydrolase [Fodinibius salsisoli]|uniref:O-Glycosyl hydrolase n=1 Tax=Fodinibius salsisoli TaxID=2820877 RepID=A0ABT3PQJ9_9BACT|nr:glycoside hydrolase [Fodinibius salsisoli]MCW9708116.1 hypothetical protein [Fodinibius salsisoli]
MAIFWISAFSCQDKNTEETRVTSYTDTLSLTVNFEDQHQEVKGFGASDAWSTQFVGKNWPLEKREQIADYLFSMETTPEGNPKGIGLSTWRFNIGAGSARQGKNSGIGDPWRRAESFLRADSTYNWNKQAGQQWFMQAASERGVKDFIGFVNSPPVLLTQTGKAFGDGSGQANISEKYYDDFADYLARIGQYFKNKGTPFTYISPVNEPQWDWSQGNGQEGSPYQNDQISGVIVALDQKIREYNLEAKIEVPEAAQINFLYDGDLTGRSHQAEHFFGSDSKVKDLPTLAPKMAGHSYFTTWPVSEMIEQRQKVRESIEKASGSIEYWMSEYCILADNEQIQGGGRDLGMSPALYVARVLHYDMTIANAVSWQWWLAVSPYDYKDGLVYIDKDTQNGEVYDSKLLWGLGNFSRFIRPGAVRLGGSRSDNATPEEAAGQLMVSAYFHDEQNKLTIVLVNYGDRERPVTVSLENAGDHTLSNLTPYLTSSEADLQKQEAVASDESVTVPARSIMTLQGDVGQ